MSHSLHEEFEMEQLVEKILQACEGKNSTIVLGALFSVAIPIIQNSPDKGYAIACSDFLENQGRAIKAERLN